MESSHNQEPESLSAQCLLVTYIRDTGSEGDLSPPHPTSVCVLSGRAAHGLKCPSVVCTPYMYYVPARYHDRLTGSRRGAVRNQASIVRRSDERRFSAYQGFKKWDDLKVFGSSGIVRCCADRVRNLDKDGRFSENTEKRSSLHSPTPSEEMHTVVRTVLSTSLDALPLKQKDRHTT